MNASDSAYVAPIGAFVASIKRQDWLIVETPYHPRFAPRAKLLGGRWHAQLRHGDRTLRAWAFDPRDSDRVAALCREFYGYDWETYATTPLGTIRVAMPRTALGWSSSIYAFGRQVCDWQVGKRGIPELFRLGAGVLMIDGSLSDTSSTLVFEIKDVPLACYESQRDEVEKQGYTVELVPDVRPESLPLSGPLTQPGSDVHPTVTQILTLWATLSPREQGTVLEELLHSTPTMAGR